MNDHCCAALHVLLMQIDIPFLHVWIYKTYSAGRTTSRRSLKMRRPCEWLHVLGPFILIHGLVWFFLPSPFPRICLFRSLPVSWTIHFLSFNSKRSLLACPLDSPCRSLHYSCHKLLPALSRYSAAMQWFAFENVDFEDCRCEFQYCRWEANDIWRNFWVSSEDCKYTMKIWNSREF